MLLFDFSAAQSYYDVALAEVKDGNIDYDYRVWPICIPQFASLDLNLR